MIDIITIAAKYLIIIMCLIYTLSCFTMFRPKNKERKEDLLDNQVIYMFVFLFLCYVVLFLQKFDLKIRLYNQEKSFGKGVYELMKKTQSFGSLSGAYKDMKMSNSKAWKILKRAEEDLDMPLVERISGGKDGGGSKLTQEGEELLEKYEKFIQEMNEYAKIRFKEIFEDE